MAALCNRAGHYTLPCGFYLSSSSSSFFLLFLAQSQRPQTGCLPYLGTWCGPSANLECRSEMCCARLAANIGRKKSPKSLGTIAQLCRAISSQLRHVSTIGKNLLNSSMSSTRRHNLVNFGLLAAEICCRVWVSRVDIVTARHSSIGRQPKICVEQRAPTIFGRAAITLGIGPHF